jgi:hypothetical protein
MYRNLTAKLYASLVHSFIHPSVRPFPGSVTDSNIAAMNTSTVVKTDVSKMRLATHVAICSYDSRDIVLLYFIYDASSKLLSYRMTNLLNS